MRLIVTVAVIAVVLTIGAVVTGFVLASRVAADSSAPATGQLAVPAAPQPGADGHYCRTLMPKLPDELPTGKRRTLIAPEPGVAAWGDPPVILRCGLADPAELTCAASLTRFTDVDGASVDWLRLSESDTVTYLAVDRPVRIAVTLTAQSGLAPVQQLSEVIARALPAQPVCSDGQVTPTDNG